jgi:hypothetical protein
MPDRYCDDCHHYADPLTECDLCDAMLCNACLRVHEGHVRPSQSVCDCEDDDS